jgi:hypothetical protein
MGVKIGDEIVAGAFNRIDAELKRLFERWRRVAEAFDVEAEDFEQRLERHHAEQFGVVAEIILHHLADFGERVARGPGMAGGERPHGGGAGGRRRQGALGSRR